MNLVAYLILSGNTLKDIKGGLMTTENTIQPKHKVKNARDLQNRQKAQAIISKINPEVQEYYCHKCGRFLCYEAIVEGTIVIPCKCGEYCALDIHQNEEIPINAGEVPSG